ncbi:MAG: LysM peptidoglycan-binding domain-containing protein [Thioalkalivibrio sp.]|nr:MAG: LysM peptidoglycan-binding domain-containing protein [Thioalkalivibrio sp.]
MGGSFRYWIVLCCVALAYGGPVTAGAADYNAQAPAGSLAEYSGSLDRELNGSEIAWTAERDSLVAAALNDWLTWMRPMLIDAYEQYMYMRHLMWPVYEQAGLPEALLFGILAKESGGRVHSVSRMGASGPLQFMGFTALRLGLRIDDERDERFDPLAATRANVAYLRERFIEYDGDLGLALAAYNAGETRVLRLARALDDPSFWNPDFFRQLPRETQEYVPYVLAAAMLFQDPQAHGVEFPVVDAVPSQIELLESKTLSELSICLGQEGSRAGWFRTLRNLNPHQEHDVRLPEGYPVQAPAEIAERYAEACLDETRNELARRLHASRDERRALLAVRTYTVRSGDTLSTIVHRQGCPSLRAVAEANGIQGPRYLIRPGQQLQLVGCRIH